MKITIKTYLNQLQTNLNIGQAKEHTLRAALEQLIETLAPTVDAVNELVRIACGSPDFVVLNKKDKTQKLKDSLTKGVKLFLKTVTRKFSLIK